MLSWLIEKTAGAVRETYNAVEATAEYSINTIADIPDAISRGWNAGLIDHTEDNPTEGADCASVESTEEPKKFGLKR